MADDFRIAKKQLTKFPPIKTKIGHAFHGDTVWRDIQPMYTAWEDICLKAMNRSEWKVIRSKVMSLSRRHREIGTPPHTVSWTHCMRRGTEDKTLLTSIFAAYTLISNVYHKLEVISIELLLLKYCV